MAWDDNRLGVVFDVGGVLLHPDPVVLQRLAMTEYRSTLLQPELLIPRLVQRMMTPKYDWGDARSIGEAISDIEGLSPDVASNFWHALLRLDREGGVWTKLDPFAALVLQSLRQRGVAVAALSNAQGNTQDQLAAVGLESYFDAVVDSALSGYEKPDRRAFAAVADLLDLAPDRLVMVGDDPANDIAGCAGFYRSAFLYDPYGLYQASAWVTIQTLREVLVQL